MLYTNIIFDPHMKAEEDDRFEELSTGSVFIYHEGHWHDEASLLDTPSTPEKVLSASAAVDAEKAPKPAPKKPAAKKTTKKTTAKK